MNNKKATKRALLTSVMALAMCVVMLVGTTFAWFTDTAKTNVNKIQAGNLDVDIIDLQGNSLDGGTLSWVKASGAAEEEVLWEPGCTYYLTPFMIQNKGNLALKYKVSISGATGDVELLDALEFGFYYFSPGFGDMRSLDELVDGGKLDNVSEYPNLCTAPIYIVAHMREDAGNEYQGMSTEGVSITVAATQSAYESDSFNNTYDESAPYPTAVGTERELLKALENGENVVLNDDMYVQYGVSVPDGKNVTIDLNGKTVTAEKNFVTVEAGGKLTVSGGTVDAGVYVFNVEGGEVVVNGGDYTAQECVFAVKSAGKLTINGGTFTAKDNSVVSTSGNIENAGSEITINGGVFNANIQTAGYIACGVYVANKDTVKINAGTFNAKNGIGVMMRAGNTTIGKDVVINLTSDGTVIAGKVADAAIQIAVGAPLVSDTASRYPGLDDTFTVTNNSAYAIVEYK